MRRSTERIITSHVGSLPRPPDLLEMMREKVNGRPYDRLAYDARCRDAVDEIVRQQAEAGIDVVTDGELSKPQFCDYIADRIAGFEGENTGPRFVNASQRPEPFPAFTAWNEAQRGILLGMQERRPLCVAPLRWQDRAYETDIANLKAVLEHVDVLEAFMPSPSPGILAMRIPNTYYASEEEYLYALADVLHDEYKAIADAGFVLQIDAPDAAMAWDRQQFDTIAEFRRVTQQRLEALNHALAGIPEEQVRFHVCWGNNESPHTNDVPLREIVDLVLQVRAACYSIEAANPRHGHEWTVWQDVKLPDGKALMPGVIDSLTSFVEHPELVAQRIVQYANLVGRENVIAGVDCGFGTGASANPRVHPELVMAKFRSLADGAALASKQLWR
ncbi:MAG TPA: cobalamin-independent methionine synthase II family protein [Dehalococcoidia bacterium]|nr:cobalamin-independent methionine synthase II family protein [Dehalococcoidia bacterium]